MRTLRNTWYLADTAWHVLRKDWELLVLPLLSLLVSGIVMVATFVFAFLPAAGGTPAGETPPLTLTLMFWYGCATLALGAISAFFRGAIVAGAHERMTGGDPTVISSLRSAASRTSALLSWGLLSATVGLVLQALRERAGFLGRIALSAIGMAWQVASFLTVPAIVIDHLGPVEGLKRSASLLRRSWGENIAAQVGFGLLGVVLVIPAILVMGLSADQGPLTPVFVAFSLAWIVTVVLFVNALQGIFQAALYMYVTTGSEPSGFEGSPLADTFVIR